MIMLAEGYSNIHHIVSGLEYGSYHMFAEPLCLGGTAFMAENVYIRYEDIDDLTGVCEDCKKVYKKRTKK